LSEEIHDFRSDYRSICQCLGEGYRRIGGDPIAGDEQEMSLRDIEAGGVMCDDEGLIFMISRFGD